MNGCIYRTKDNECDLWTDDKHKAFCDPDCTDKHPSEGDKIRAMNDEELATVLFYGASAEKSFKTESELLDWLKQEAN